MSIRNGDLANDADGGSNTTTPSSDIDIEVPPPRQEEEDIAMVAADESPTDEPEIAAFAPSAPLESELQNVDEAQPQQLEQEYPNAFTTPLLD